ncbi:fimbrial protein [Escherichia coli]|nr:fimbrial protein [Escherichia coli]EEV3965604.1 fimbrial protein [Escherichia coli]EEW7191524.1 fimbrial protein [Escherichia coli]EFE2372615.1 fimbrial protein [Escherichia coli]EFE5447221.1 fimbrial protein [Escherichia coli]
MKYNNIIFLGLCLGLTTYSALSADSVIKISGRVLDYGCTVSSDSLNFTVDLQKNSARQFPTTGSTSPAVPFQITLSECSKGTTGVRVAFNGIEDAENNTLLKLDEGSNTASGLGIEILDGNMRPNLLLMKGNIGKPGAGICPLRGHSNVQGDRTVGITEKPSVEFLARLGERYGFTPPHVPGHAAIASMQAICTGQARALICMGGNFALAMPDREASAVPLTQLDLAVHVATKLNRSHLLTARHSYILPVLGRSEIDMQKSGAQAVTVEDSMSMIHASRGVLKPAGVMLKSECAVVAGIAQATLPQSVVAWEYLVEDYDRIRNDIEAVLPEFADYNQRIRHPGGFHLINAAAERRWMTPSGKANFITSKGLLEDPSSAFNSKLVMATVRSHDQYNTTIYGMDDRYRGVFGQRDVVFMSAKQAKICRVKNGERVNLIALTPDGKRSSRRMDRLKVVIYPMADRSLVTYFPESNHMLTLDNHDPLSGIPGYKSIPVELEPSN